MIEPYKPLYTVKEVSQILVLSINDTNALLNKGVIPYLKLGSRKVRGRDLERFIENYPAENREDTSSRRTG